jgi:hypothetical protein
MMAEFNRTTRREEEIAEALETGDGEALLRIARKARAMATGKRVVLSSNLRPPQGDDAEETPNSPGLPCPESKPHPDFEGAREWRNAAWRRFSAALHFASMIASQRLYSSIGSGRVSKSGNAPAGEGQAVKKALDDRLEHPEQRDENEAGAAKPVFGSGGAGNTVTEIVIFLPKSQSHRPLTTHMDNPVIKPSKSNTVSAAAMA